MIRGVVLSGGAAMRRDMSSYKNHARGRKRGKAVLGLAVMLAESGRVMLSASALRETHTTALFYGAQKIFTRGCEGERGEKDGESKRPDPPFCTEEKSMRATSETKKAECEKE